MTLSYFRIGFAAERKDMSDYKLIWEPVEGGARLLRAFGEQPYAKLPESLAGDVLLTEIGAYCFAKDGRLPKKYHVEESLGTAALHELSGDYLKTLVLPDCVKKIGNLAFYNCTSLEMLEIGKNMTETGSDAFMNCRNFHRIKVRCKVSEPSGACSVLNQISSDMQVIFGEKETEAELLFSEYYESYDEVAPAHLFGRNIEGEGFRARQCFKDGIMDFKQYDRIFPKACSVEPAGTLCGISMNRLRYPVDLDEESRQRYCDYISSHAKEICLTSIKKKETKTITFLCENGLADKEALEESILMAAQSEWAEGAACILSMKEKFFPQKSVRERYAFEDF